MPTYQTTPYISWTFPDQAIAMNIKGVQPLQPVDLPQQEMVYGGQHYGWAEDARKMALARLETNRIKDKGMRGLLNTTDRSQAFDRPAHLSQTRINGKFEHPSYQYTQTPSGLRGGTGLLTKEGRAWAKRKLQQRVQELNAIDTQNYSAGPPAKITILPDQFRVENALAKLLNYVYSGSYSTDILDSLLDVATAVVTASSSMTSQDVARYVNALNPLAESIERTLALEGGLEPETQKILRVAERRIKQLYKLLTEIASASELPQVAKDKSLRLIADKFYKSFGEAARPQTLVRGRRTIRVPQEQSGQSITDFFARPTRPLTMEEFMALNDEQRRVYLQNERERQRQIMGLENRLEQEMGAQDIPNSNVNRNI